MNSKKYLLLQINDGLFPIGAYSHSFGLETYIQKNIVKDYESALKYISNKLRFDFLYSDLLVVKLSYQYAINSNLEKINELEDIVEASRAASEIRVANRKLGSRFIKTVKALNIEYESEIFNKYLVDREKKSTNYQIVYGVFCASMNMSYEEVIEKFVYAQASAMVTNCVKSIPLSQSDGQKLLVDNYRVFDEIIEKVETTREEMLCLSTPSFDIRGMQHEVLYSRLYMS